MSPICDHKYTPIHVNQDFKTVLFCFDFVLFLQIIIAFQGSHAFSEHSVNTK